VKLAYKLFIFVSNINIIFLGIVTTKDKIQAKLKNRGTPCMFVGYSVHHANDVYRMLNLDTEMIINSQDIIWLNKKHEEWVKRKVNSCIINNVDDSDVVESITRLNDGNQATAPS
jgi:hypothetical protein